MSSHLQPEQMRRPCHQVSSHNTHNVFVYERTPALNRHAEPDAVLRNVLCPHGVRFTADGRFILVADASARCVNVYRGDGTGWKGALDPWSQLVRRRSHLASSYSRMMLVVLTSPMPCSSLA